MYLDGEAIGVLNVEVKRHGRLKPHHVGLVEMLADVTAVAIGSSRQDAMRGTMLQLVEGVLSADDASPNVDIIRDGVQDVIDDVDCHFWYRRASGDRFEWISSRKSSLEPRTGANAGCPNGCGTRAWTGSGRTCAG
jgi:hypothetical protein